MRINHRVSIAVTQVLGPAPRGLTITNMLTRYRQAIHTGSLVRFGEGFNPPIDARCVVAVIEKAYPFLFDMVRMGRFEVDIRAIDESWRKMQRRLP